MRKGKSESTKTFDFYFMIFERMVTKKNISRIKNRFIIALVRQFF